jgi:uncharacterized membrane protein YbhN (UPF0104 family)
MPKYLKIVLNILLVTLVCYGLNYFKILDFSKITKELILENWGLIIFCILLLGFVNTMAGLRWYILARMINLSLKLSEVISITQKAGIFVYFLPAQLAVDSLRIAKFTNPSNGNNIKTLIVASVIDRIIALISQCFLLMVLVTIIIYDGYKLTLLLVAVVLALIFTKMVLQNYMIGIINKLGRKFNYLYFINLNTISYLFIFSLFLNLLVSWVVFLLSQIFGMDLPFILITISTIASNLSTIIPITPNGIGLSEVIFAITTNYFTGMALTGVAIAYVGFRLVNYTSYIFANTLLLLLELSSEYSRSQK